MQKYVRWIIRWRFAVIGLCAVLTVFLVPRISQLKIVVDPQALLPQSHDYVVTSNKVADLFGSRHVVIVGVTPKHGDVFQANVLDKIQRLTKELLGAPGVVKDNTMSLSTRRVKDISGDRDELTVKPLMASVPKNASQMEELRRAVQRNPVYRDTIVSADNRTAAIVAEFRDSAGGFRQIVDKVNSIVAPERDTSVDIAVGGFPVFLANVEAYSERVFYLLPVIILIIALIHLEAFRTLQGLILPLVTALLATAWDLGIMGISGIPFDVVTVTIPIVILAVAAGHAVQLLKRYYEEYHLIREGTKLSASGASDLAIVQSVASVGPVMLIAGTIASLSFFSLTASNISMVRNLGVFSGIGILCALFLELTFIPALRSLLPPPGDMERHRERDARLWDRITGSIVRLTTIPSHRRRLYAVVLAILAIAIVGTMRIVVDNSVRSYFSDDLPFLRDDRSLNGALGGSNTLYLVVEGASEDAIKDPSVLRAMDATQRLLEQQPSIGKTVSIVDFIKRIHQVMHGNDPAYYRVPDSRELISQYLLLYSMSGNPTDFDAYVDSPYRTANITAYLKNDRSSYLNDLVEKIHGATQLSKDTRLSIGGSTAQNAAVSDVLVHEKVMNILLIVAVIFTISSIVFRSVIGGLLVISPLVVTVLVTTAEMGLCGIKLNIPTSLSFATIVGIGADFTIYLIYRMREYIAQGVEDLAAIRAVLNTAGKACLYVATAVACGYSVLLLSFGFYVHIWMGLLIVTGMLVSVFSALLLIPALILTVRPKFIFVRNRLAPAYSSAVTILLAVIAAVLAPGKPAVAADLTATAIMEKNFVVSKVSDSVSDATMTLISKSGQERVRRISSTTKLRPNGVDNMRMTRFLSPPDVRGTVTLLIERSDQEDDEVWIYLPALKKVRRLVSSNKKDSFMGSDFSYGDVIGYKVGNWRHRLLREEAVGGKPCYVIESLPKDDAVKADSGYSKRVTWIGKDNFVTVKAEFWDDSGQPYKAADFEDIQLVDSAHGKWQAMRLQVTDQQSGHRTVIQIGNFKVDQGAKDSFFTTRNMERE